MLLTDHERDFLAAFIHEATTDPFKGPATAQLHRRDIYYTDLANLLSAYYQEIACAQDGSGRNHVSMPPPCPWPDQETALQRNQEIGAELKRTVKQVAS